MRPAMSMSSSSASAMVLALPTGRAIRQLALPAILSLLFIMLFNVVDGWWVGKLGAEGLAGVSAASFIYWALEALATITSTGVSALVARYVGAGRYGRVHSTAVHGISLAGLLGLIFGGLTILLMPAILDFMSLQGAVRQSARHYLTLICAGLFVLFASLSAEAVFRAMGDTRTPLKITAGALLFNAVIDPFFIFGIGPLPRLEAAGAALATVLAHVITLIVMLRILRQRKIPVVFRLAVLHQAVRRLLTDILRIGLPIAFSGVMFSLSYAFLTRIIARYGPEALAAIGLGHRIEGLAYFTCVGFSVAATTLVGQNLGAGNPRRAEKSAWLTLSYACVVVLGFSIFFMAAAKPLVRFFIDDAAVVREGSAYLRIIAVFEIFLAFEVVLEGAFSGAGFSLPPMLVSVPLTWLRIPFAAWLAGPLGLGSAGIWWAISCTTALKGVVIGVWFKQGGWKKPRF